MPMSAADVRRRGDRLRRRRTALVAGGAALAVAAVVVPVLALGGHDSDQRRDDLITKDPASSALGEADLLSDEDTEYEVGSTGAFRTTETFTGDGQAAYHVCQQGTPSSLGATDSRTRTFAMRPPEEASDLVSPPSEGLVEMIAEFPDAATARAAYDTWRGWIDDCGRRLGDFERHFIDPEPAVADLPAGSEGVIYDLSWGPVSQDTDPDGDAGFINETGLIVQGDRVAVLGLTIVGQDYNFLEEYGGTPVTRMLPRAAALLEPGDDPASVRPTGTAGAGETAIPDDFPLGDGWPYGTEADGEGLIGPARELEPATFEACGAAVEDPAHEDRLMARWQSVDYRTRQLTTYATAEEASGAITTIADLYRACPTDQQREDGSTPRWEVRDLGIGDESYAVLGWDESDGVASTFGSTMVLVRVGNAVLLTAWSGHAGNPEAGGDEAVEAITGAAAPVIEAMCVFTADGC